MIKHFRLASLLWLGCLLAAQAVEVEALSKQLSAPETKFRRKAAYALNKLGAESAPALPALIKALDDDDTQVWYQSTMALAAIGPEAASAIPRLIHYMDGAEEKHKDQRCHRCALALSRIGKAAIQPLLKCLSDEDTLRRLGAVKALGWMADQEMDWAPDQIIAHLVALLDDPEAGVQAQTCESLIKFGPLAAGPLAKRLQSKDETARLQAARTLSSLGKQAIKQSVPLLDALRGESSTSVRDQLLTTVVEIGADPELVVPILIETLVNEPTSSKAAVASLMAVRQADVQVVPHLAILLQHQEAATRMLVAELLERLGTEATSAAHAVVQRLAANPDNDEGEALIRALSAMGPSALTAINEFLETISLDTLSESHWSITTVKALAPHGERQLREFSKNLNPARSFALLQALPVIHRPSDVLADVARNAFADPAVKIRRSAFPTLAVIALPEFPWINFLKGGLADNEASVRAAATRALEASPLAKDKRVPHLLSALQDDSAAVQSAALDQFTRLGDLGAPGAKAMITLLASPDPDVVLKATQALGVIGDKASPAAASLAALIPTEDPILHTAALKSLGSLNRAAQPHLAVVQEQLTHVVPEVREQALRAFVSLGAERDVLQPVLVKALDNASATMREFAVEALGDFKHHARPAARRIIELLDTDRNKRLILDALRKINPDDLDLCLEALASDDSTVRLFAAEQLGNLGDRARAAIPQLRKATKDRSSSVRRRAEETLKKLNK